MMKNDMTPTEAFAFRLKHEHEIKAVTYAVIWTAVITTLALIVLSPILVPLWIVQKVINGARNTWNWFFPQPEADETLQKVRAQFKKARRRK